MLAGLVSSQAKGLAQRRRGAEMFNAMRENDIGTRVLEAAINVHRELGPGLLETVYEIVLARESYPKWACWQKGRSRCQ